MAVYSKRQTHLQRSSLSRKSDALLPSWRQLLSLLSRVTFTIIVLKNKKEKKKKRQKRKETKARQAPYSESEPRNSPSPRRVNWASKDINIFPYLRSHRRQKPFHFGPILMPILVPQVSISCPSQASHTNKRSMSGTASDTLPWRELPTRDPQRRGAPLPETPSSSLCLLSRSLCIICPQLCLYHRGWQTIPALRNAFSTGQAIPAPLGGSAGGEGAGPCPAYCQGNADAPPLSLRAGKAPEKTSSPRKIADSPGADLKGCNPRSEPQPRRFSLLGKRQQLEHFLLGAFYCQRVTKPTLKGSSWQLSAGNSGREREKEERKAH